MATVGSEKYVPHGLGLDLTDKVKPIGDHYFAIGDHADIWNGSLDTGSGTPSKVVIKLLRGGSSGNQEWIDGLKNRLKTRAGDWFHFHHPNVSQFLGLSFHHTYMPSLVLPFYPNGNIIRYLDKTKKSDNHKLHMLKEITEGIAYIHDLGVVHGDIRGANVLINEECRPVLCDYGLAFIIVGSEFTSVKTAGTCRWASPEVMNPPELSNLSEDDMDEYKDTNDPVVFFTKASDIYAFAMLMIEVFSGMIPFSKKKNDSAVIFSVLAGKRPELPPFLAANKCLDDLVNQCWHQTPADRPTANHVHTELEASGLAKLDYEGYSLIRLWGYLRQWIPI